jgi:hypothetical protein
MVSVLISFSQENENMSSTPNNYNESDPAIVVNLSALVGLSNAGVQLNEYWEQLSALRVLAASRPLTFAEEVEVDQAECNIEEFAMQVQSNYDHFADKQKQVVA